MRFAWEDGPGRGIKAIPHSKLQLVRELFFPKYGDVFVISGPARHANLLWHWQYVPFYKYCMTLVLDMQFVPVESGSGSRRLSWRHGTVTYEWRSPLSRFDCSMFQSTIATGLFDSITASGILCRRASPDRRATMAFPPGHKRESQRRN